MDSILEYFDESVNSVGIYNVVCSDCGHKVVVVTPDDEIEEGYDCTKCSSVMELGDSNLIEIVKRSVK